ncbi:WD repeat and FYVE domain-containing protein 3 isoform X1 [Dendroctonus ponderosae]|uniref:WD repeat and FYVE domain-containing protein 3 isoform X1 n=1 Tax=Dendroctonus ponderosae TaxID=77166 RepID=UPI0020361CDB|nr:WD repeat and FYVE domain-containing protein 3 isoform X1 [Dendroctonus ponderosae]XP_048518987.1 WD repeat and FYVE domain-containing protein 3 isoform X1 [Dendroctonus ponderosae]XP_048518995.1 WD repeat and FYVE domain-containing protein 3 isoform X1 [Dendroctonus ponderosae]
MNIMRKLRSAGGTANASVAENSGDTSSSHTQLGLMHLKKLFLEYMHPPQPLSDQEKDDKLYNMLPLFCKVFGASPSCDMNEKFWDILAFCQQVSLLMVSEIRKRASNQSTEAASSAIATFLEIENCEESSNGWMLLSTLNLLAAGNITLIQVMSEVSVPSTLVKCLYIFFDLPLIPEKESNTKDFNSDFTRQERRILLQKIFVQLLVRLCSHRIPAEELAKKDDLTLLFSAITSVCPSYNVMWRKSAAEVLMTLSRHGLTPPVVGYIHNKSCVALCIDNMKKVPELAPLELVEMFVTVFCFLKDSSDVSSTLLDDFRQAQGYAFLSEFLLKLEHEKSAEAQEAIRNSVLMITSLCMCGYIELKPSQASTGSLFLMPGFILPQPSGRGASVRNIQAFHVLQNTFLKSNSTLVCGTILDAISSIYHSDNANYFILENENTLSQFSEKIHHKPAEVQKKMFELIEFLVFTLNFVPCKELISMSIFLKSHSLNHAECSILCMKTLLNILKHNVIFKDVYREVGLLEVIVTLLSRYASFLENKKIGTNKGKDYVMPPGQEKLGGMIIEAIILLLSGNISNATVLRECGGAKCVHGLVQYLDCRYSALGIIKELVLTSGGDDDMGHLLNTLQSATRTDLSLKIDILEALKICLKESHRTRTVFRKANGFIYVTSVLVALEGRLSKPETDAQVLQLLALVFQTICIAMRFEPANAKFFYYEVCRTSLCDTLKLLGCFSSEKVEKISENDFEPSTNDHHDVFHNLFVGPVVNVSIPDGISAPLAYTTIVYRLMYDLALDLYDRANMNTAMYAIKSPPLSREQSLTQGDSDGAVKNKRTSVNSLNFNPPSPEPIIVHPGVVICMYQLLPCIQDKDFETHLSLQLYLAEVIKSLVRSERNQQVMCDKGFVNYILEIGFAALQNESHPLHGHMQYMLERLAAQALESIDLRTFLRFGNPLCCLPLGSTEQGGGPVPLTRIKTIVSMTTPKDFRAQASYTSPPFIEFDMSAEGFGCLFLPSIAPQSLPAASVVSGVESCVLGGIGSGDRLFPPQTGLSYSTWICVDKFSDPRTDPHSVHLLTLVRNYNGGKDDVVCLSLVLSTRDKAIIVSTRETRVPNNLIGDWEPDGSGEYGARVWYPDLLKEAQWHHIVVVLNRAVLKNSSFSLYIDGQQVHSQKMHYISQSPGGPAVNMNTATSVYGYIGTPPAWRRFSKLCWKQGSCHLFEEVLPPATVSQMYQLGPHYMGSFLAPNLLAADTVPLVTEEKVVFGLNAKAVSWQTLNNIRKVYSRSDNKSIAKQLGMSSRESATPIRVLHNSAGHLAGSARTLGGIVIGYLGVRVFCPRPVATTIDTIGGCSVLLGLIAMAQDQESLYAGVKALVCVVRSNKVSQAEMDRRRSYQTLAMLFRRKRHLLNSHILHLAFGLVGTVDSGRESSAIPNKTAFQDLLCDLEVWHEAPGELLRSHLEHLYELVYESNEKKYNTWVMRDLGLVEKLLHITPDVKHAATRQVLFSLLSTLLGSQPRPNDLLLFGQFISSTLPRIAAQNEKNISLKEGEPECENILLRNRCLNVLHSLVFSSRNQVGEEITKVLGFDWLISFMQPEIHSTSCLWAFRILVAACSSPFLICKFRDGTSNGGWLRYAEQVAHNKMAVVLGCPPHSPLSTGEYKSEALHIPGFQYLYWLLPSHLDIPEVYFLLTALMMGQPAKLLPADTKFDLDTVWGFLWGSSVNNQPINSVVPRITLSSDAVVVLLGMMRALLHSDQATLPEWLQDHTTSIVQVLFQLYHNMPEFMPIFMSSEVLSALASTLFPLPARSSEDSAESSGASTPAEEGGMMIVPRSPSEDEPLTNHPARQFVIDFIRVIVVDSLSLSSTGKASPVIDLALDAYPIDSSNSQQVAYQTEVLLTLMEHLLAADMLVGDQAAIPIVPLASAHIQHVAPNVIYLAARILDKLWQGALNRDPHEVFDFIVKLIGQAKRRTGNLSLEGLYHCLNRSILFLLSRNTDSIADQMSVLEALHKLTTNRLIVFGAGNHELDFIGCLTYCLLQLTADMRITLETNNANSIPRTTWHVNPGQDLESRDELLNAHQGRNLMATAAIRVWEELYVCKKPAIEEVFKVTLASPNLNAKAPDLVGVREQIYDAAVKLWLNYIESERKAAYKVPWELHNQLQSKIHKVTGGLTRLASRTKVRKDEMTRIRVNISRKQALNWVISHVGIISDLVEMRRQQHQNTTQHTQRYMHQEWLQTETELTRERGLWGPVESCHLDKWMLDMTEGPHRMRKKTMKNDLFYIHYPFRIEHEKGLLRYKVATSYHSKDYYQALQKRQHIGVSGLTLEPPERTDSISEELSPMPYVALPHLTRLTSDPEDLQEENDNEEDQPSPPPDNQTLLRLLEHNEKVSFMFRVARIQGLDTTEGLLLFGQEHCYIVDGFTLLKNREIRDIDSVPHNANEYEPILPNPGSPRRSRTMRQCSKFSYDDIREVHKRRYLLQPMALEVFSGDGRNYLLAFPRKQRNKVYQKFMTTATGISDSAQQSVAGQKRTANVEQATSLLSNLIGETSVTQRWVRGEISNFQYLMYLNTLAGRSYNDLMQYPVFPWILADYDAEELDLTDASTFRDFTRPMGAQSPDRLEQFKKRFREWDDPTGDTPPYHYGTHYSSAMIVCSYLVRLEPFTQHFLRLQGGHFDLADRMFHSIKEAWTSASKHNMADVKELIPEFFYLPEFLTNDNQFDLGVKQNGVALGDVILPPWAKQDPREFIRAHREALECDYVSQNLHHWIDLIFGYKQHGPPAVESVNVFHHLFYEGNVDIYKIDDPLKKNATIGFINNFGQIPKQLFKKPHPCKKMGNNNRASVIIDTGSLVQAFTLPQPDKLFFHHLDNLRPSLQPIKEVKLAVGQILQVDKSVLAVEQNKVLIPPTFNKYVAWGFADHSIRIGNYESERAVFVSENVEQNNGEILACVCPSAKLIVTAGTGSVVTVWSYETRKKAMTIKHQLYAHTEAVTCLAASPAYNVIVSGSRDSSAIIWDLSRGVFVRQLTGHAGPVAAVAVNELTGDIATCAATWLHVWSINGCALAAVNTCVGRADRMQQILCVAFSQAHDWDPMNVIITGSTDGVTRMWSLDYVQVPIEDDHKNSNIVKPKADGNSNSPEKINTEVKPATPHHRLVKQVHVSNDNARNLMKSGSESSLSGDASPKVKIEMVITSEGSPKEWQREHQDEKEACSDGEEMSPPVPPVRRRRSRVHGGFRSEGGQSADACSLDIEDASGLRTSKSDTSLTDSFVIVDNQKRNQNPHNALRPGFKWQRQLVFRSKLTMHTAYDRKDNTEPASISALAVSKDHRIFYVGDTRGRVFSWSVSDVVGRAADHWLKDEGAENCASCSVRFTIYERRHHCRNCGQVFCSRCSRFESEISRLRILKPVRVCQTCYASLKGDHK